MRQSRRLNVTHGWLLEHVTYEGDTGKFFVRKMWHKKIPVGKELGCRNNYGYYQIQINKVLILRHILAFFYVNAKWPEETIDHINGIPGDDRISNLRPATRSQNQRNRKPANNRKYLGVSLHRAPTGGGIGFTASIQANRKKYYIGRYPTEELAAMAYDAVAKELHGEFAKLNFPENCK